MVNGRRIVLNAAKPEFTVGKIMLLIWWVWQVTIYYPNIQTLYSVLYCRTMSNRRLVVLVMPHASLVTSQNLQKQGLTNKQLATRKASTKNYCPSLNRFYYFTSKLFKQQPPPVSELIFAQDTQDIDEYIYNVRKCFVLSFGILVVVPSV